MGTLTGNVPSLSEHCPHKLPTSCRLTATAKCCACQDRRGHQNYYSIYVDGVGFVARGTRWQKYCWFCKTFWDNRLKDSFPRIDASQTRIPDIPDQTLFLDRWFEYHRGYREDKSRVGGSNRHIPLELPQAWSEVEPGHLPGRSAAESSSANARDSDRRQGQDEARNTQERGASIENTIDHLLDEATREEQPSHEPTPMSSTARPLRSAWPHNIQHRHHSQPPNPFSFGTTPLSTSDRLDNASNALAADLARVSHSIDQMQASVLRAERDQRAARAAANALGTREEVDRLGANYVSPISDMFNRAYERFHAAEQERDQVRRDRPLVIHEPGGLTIVSADSPFVTDTSDAQSQLPPTIDIELDPDDYDDSDSEHDESDEDDQPPPRTLDGTDDGRPPARSDAELVVKLACRVCFTQMANMALVPCGHLIMCEWCAAIEVPPNPADATQPLFRGARCPLCRKVVRGRLRVFVGVD